MNISCLLGLGNPGELYHNSRHNVGFMILDKLAQVHNLNWRKPWWKPYHIAELELETTLSCCKPTTFMNHSGRAAFSVMRKLRLNPENILVIYDDVNLPLGKIRYRARGSSGGHNGMKSIIAYLQSDQFPRLRVGIGQDPNDRISHVLGKFDQEEMDILNHSIDFIVETLPKLGSQSEENLMQNLNSWKNPTR